MGGRKKEESRGRRASYSLSYLDARGEREKKGEKRQKRDLIITHVYGAEEGARCCSANVCLRREGEKGEGMKSASWLVLRCWGEERRGLFYICSVAVGKRGGGGGMIACLA